MYKHENGIFLLIQLLAKKWITLLTKMSNYSFKWYIYIFSALFRRRGKERSKKAEAEQQKNHSEQPQGNMPSPSFECSKLLNLWYPGPRHSTAPHFSGMSYDRGARKPPRGVLNGDVRDHPTQESTENTSITSVRANVRVPLHCANYFTLLWTLSIPVSITIFQTVLFCVFGVVSILPEIYKKN